MDFFQHQDDARRKTTRAVLLFILALVLILLVINGTVALVIMAARFNVHSSTLPQLKHIAPQVYLLASTLTILVILGASVYRMIQLGKGGAAIAAMVGARRAFRHSTDARERQLINVVEEMAIASGMPVPGTYVMDAERGINAFAAGHNLHNAVVVVTKGALVTLDRAELQGVVAHEFSHILNGDMALNIRLAGILNGIQFIGAIGQRLCLGMGRVSRADTDWNAGSLRGEIQTHPAMLAVGVLLMLAGYGGLFIAKLIKSHISRQREFLADASAVQFTRSTEGITGALHKMRAHLLGTRIRNKHAETLSHLFFGESFANYFFPGLLATHPPLTERIRRIDPSFPLDTPAPAITYAKPYQEPAPDAPVRETLPAETLSTALSAGAMGVLATVGQPLHKHLVYAAQLRAQVPRSVIDALDAADGVGAVIYALALDRHDDNLRQRQLENIAQAAGENTAIWTRNLFAVCLPLGDRLRLPILELALPELELLKGASRELFVRILDQLIALDGKRSLRRFILKNIVHARLAATQGKRKRQHYHNLQPLMGHCAILMSLLAHCGNQDTQLAGSAYRKGMAHLGVGSADPLPLTNIILEDVAQALRHLARLTPLPRREVMRACTEIVVADDKVSLAEGELLRLVAEALECPLPPILQDEAAH